MKPNTKYLDENGVEYVLYPLQDLNITQDSFNDYSHRGSWAIDHNKSSGVKEPVFAPFTGKLVVTDATNGQGYFESTDWVHHANGDIAFGLFFFAHSEDLPISGTTFSQGDLMFHTGAMGIGTGDHIHIEVAPNIWSGQTLIGSSGSGYDVWIVNGQQNPSDSFFIDDTNIINGGEHEWIETGSTPVIKTVMDEIDAYFILGFIGG